MNWPCDPVGRSQSVHNLERRICIYQRGYNSPPSAPSSGGLTRYRDRLLPRLRRVAGATSLHGWHARRVLRHSPRSCAGGAGFSDKTEVATHAPKAAVTAVYDADAEVAGDFADRTALEKVVEPCHMSQTASGSHKCQQRRRPSPLLQSVLCGYWLLTAAVSTAYQTRLQCTL